MRPPGRRLGQDAFEPPANNRVPAYWTQEDDVFAQPWEYAAADSLCANPPLSRLEEVVTTESR